MEVKLIVTHISPDLDAVASVWIFKRFNEQHAGNASMYFVPAGDTIDRKVLAGMKISEQEVVHVDTGMGRFDHHTEELALKRVCAASLVRDFVVEIHPELEEDEALRRMVDHFVDVDHFGEFFWPESNNDRYLFQLEEILSYLKSVGEDDEGVVEFGVKALDACYASFRSRIAAEQALGEGSEFKTKWGKGLALETSNDDAIKYAQKAGYCVVVRKDPEYGHIRIKAAPRKNIDLTDIYEKIVEVDKKGTWYFHPAKTMLLNGSRKKQNQVPSLLSLKQVISFFGESNKTRKTSN